MFIILEKNETKTGCLQFIALPAITMTSLKGFFHVKSATALECEPGCVSASTRHPSGQYFFRQLEKVPAMLFQWSCSEGLAAAGYGSVTEENPQQQCCGCWSSCSERVFTLKIIPKEG
jgi:hypothetical protein